MMYSAIGLFIVSWLSWIFPPWKTQLEWDLECFSVIDTI